MLDKLNELTEGHGALKPGRGLVTGVLALSLAFLCFLGVLAFHFPEYLTTPELRKSYDVALIRQLMFWSLVVAGALSLVNLVFRRAPWLAGAAFALVLLCALLGGHKVEVDPNFPDHTPYIGLD
ncbi:MAG: sterol desaturase family protein, partial [Hydrogenophaga sp.]